MVKCDFLQNSTVSNTPVSLGDETFCGSKITLSNCVLKRYIPTSSNRGWYGIHTVTRD